MKKHVKLLVLVLSLALIIGAVAIVSYAADTGNVAKVGDTEYATFAEAFAAAKNSTLTLLADVTLTSENELLGGRMIIDLNGHTMNVNTSHAFRCNSGNKIAITGEGNIICKGALFYCGGYSADSTFELLGTGSGINVVSTGELYSGIVKKGRGIYNFENVNFESTMKASGAVFYGAYLVGGSGQGSAKYTLNNCTLKMTQTVNSTNCRLFYFEKSSGASTNPDAYLKISNSYMKFTGPFAGGEHFASGESFVVENSTIIQELSPAQAKVASGTDDSGNTTYTDGRKTGFIWGNPTSVIFKDSFVQYCYRFNVCGAAVPVNLVNSTLRFSEEPYELTGGDCMLSRYGDINFDKDSAFIANQNYRIGWDTATGGIKLCEGARIDTLSRISDASSRALYEDGSTYQTSTTYKMVFDPCGNAAAPYVVVKITADSESNDTTYDPAKVYGVQYMYNGYGRLGDGDSVIYGDDGVKNSTSLDIAGVMRYYNTGSTTAGRGTHLAAMINGNRVYKYWANPTDTQTSGTRVIGDPNSTGTVPCFFIEKKIGATGNKVIVHSMDFATDSVYCNIGVLYYIPNADGNKVEVFAMDQNGKFTNSGKLAKDDTVTDPFVDIKTLSCTQENGWNRIEAVLYPETAKAHIYFNGNYVGSLTVKDATSGTGFRFNLSHKVTVNSSILLDNFYARSFIERDATDTTEGKFTPSVYLAKYEKNSTSNESVVGAGKLYNSVTEALTAANKVGINSVQLFKDSTPQTVVANGRVNTNGYKLNWTEASYGFDTVVTDGNITSYVFDSENKMEYYWDNGSGGADESAMKVTTVKGGRTPVPPEDISYTYVYVKNNENGRYYRNTILGWSSEPFATQADCITFSVVTSAQVADCGGVSFVYPVFSESFDISSGFTWVITDLDGNFKRGGNEPGLWGSRIRDNIKPAMGEIFVLCSGDIAWSGGFDQTTFGEGTFNIDLNGFTLKIDCSEADNRKTGTFFNIKANQTINVYSSRAGGVIESIGINDFNISHKKYWKADNPESNGGFLGVPEDAYTKGASGGALFTMIPASRDHASNNGDTNYNAHLNVGTYNGLYAGNLTIKSSSPIMADSGDKTCTVTVDGTTMIRNAPDYCALVSTRFFYGTVTVKNSTFYSGVDNSIFGAFAAAATIVDGALTESPTSTFVIDNCTAIIKDNGKSIFTNDYAMGDITISNTVTNGSIKHTSNYKANITAGEGNVACEIIPDAFAKGVVTAAYNVPMVLDGDTLNVPYIYVPNTSKTPGTISYKKDIEYLTFTVASNGYEGAADLVLPVLAVKTVKAEDVVKVTFAGLGANEATVVDYAKGGNVVAPTIADANLNVLKLVWNGNFDAELPTNVQEDVTLTPAYDVKTTMSGVKVNLSIYSDFIINLYVPAEYKEYITKITDGTDVLVTDDVKVGDTDYVKVVIRKNAEDATSAANFVISLTDGEYTKDVTVSISIADYANAILAGESYTPDDKQLMYYMLKYANEAYKYFGDKTNYNATITEILENNESAKGDGMAEQTYANAIENLAFGGVITGATVQLTDSPAFIFYVAEGFDGTVTVKYGTNEKEITVKAGDTYAKVEGMKIYNFGSTLTVSAEGNIGENAVSLESATYNLDTFAKYHSGSESADSIAAMPLIEALYDYVQCADLYTEKN